MAAAARAFRAAFNPGDICAVQWYPMHMQRASMDMARIARRMDFIIEMHDARLPFTGRNDFFDTMSSHLPRVLMLNKCDLANPSTFEPVKAHYKSRGLDVMYTDCTLQFDRSVKPLLAHVKASVREIRERRPKAPALPNTLSVVTADGSAPQFDHDDRWIANLPEEDAIRVMVIGLPNVGKSSFINQLRRIYTGAGKAAITGDRPGVTRSLKQYIKICDSPRVYLVDTPGIMVPRVASFEMGMQLAMIGTMQDEVVGHRMIADYILYRLNRAGMFNYVDLYKMSGPSDDIKEVLTHIAFKMGRLKKGGVPELTASATAFIHAYRNAKLGRLTLDRMPRQPNSVPPPKEG